MDGIAHTNCSSRQPKAGHLGACLAAIRGLSFITLVIITLATATPLRAQDATTLHILLVADTKDATIGPDVRIDGNNMFNRVAQEIPPHRRTLTLFTGERVTRQAITDYYRELPVRATDALFLYFAGHGAVDEKGHFLAMADGNRFHRSDILQMMKAKGARLVVLISDSVRRC